MMNTWAKSRWEAHRRRKASSRGAAQLPAAEDTLGTRREVARAQNLRGDAARKLVQVINTLGSSLNSH
jgi:hypothetical protein